MAFFDRGHQYSIFVKKKTKIVNEAKAKQIF